MGQLAKLGPLRWHFESLLRWFLGGFCEFARNAIDLIFSSSSLIKGALDINLIPVLTKIFFLVGLVEANNNLLIIFVVKLVNIMWVLACYKHTATMFIFFLEKNCFININLTCKYLFPHKIYLYINVIIHSVNIF